NSDIEADCNSFSDAVQQTLQDRLLPGLGQARVRYTVEMEETEVEPKLGDDGMELAPGYTEEKKSDEDCVIDYVYWQDFIWSPCRVWGECRWVAFRAYMTKDAAKKRFPDHYTKLEYKKNSNRRNERTEGLNADAWLRAEVWEIWDKESNRVVWWSKNVETLMDKKEDPLQLEGFWPCPKPFVTNVTTSKFVPKSDYSMVQDQYSEIDMITTRLNILQEAVKVVGVYDKEAEGVQRMFQESFQNDLIPVDNWALFAERGGIRGQI
ncbi:unnamed protein product, partial [marine sediment metagenome]